MFKVKLLILKKKTAVYKLNQSLQIHPQTKTTWIIIRLILMLMLIIYLKGDNAKQTQVKSKYTSK